MKDTTTAQTILAQLGGGRFAAMTGSRNFVSDINSLRMKLARNQAGAQYLEITLTPMDLYDMTFSRINPKTAEVITLAEHNGIYNDQLQLIFTKVTGLYTHL